MTQEHRKRPNAKHLATLGEPGFEYILCEKDGKVHNEFNGREVSQEELLKYLALAKRYVENLEGACDRCCVAHKLSN